MPARRADANEARVLCNLAYLERRVDLFGEAVTNQRTVSVESDSVLRQRGCEFPDCHLFDVCGCRVFALHAVIGLVAVGIVGVCLTRLPL